MRSSCANCHRQFEPEADVATSRSYTRENDRARAPVIFPGRSVRRRDPLCLSAVPLGGTYLPFRQPPRSKLGVDVRQGVTPGITQLPRDVAEEAALSFLRVQQTRPPQCRPAWPRTPRSPDARRCGHCQPTARGQLSSRARTQTRKPGRSSTRQACSDAWRFEE